MKKNLLEIKKLRVKANSKEILKNINLAIKKGEIQALLGPNASGKSTLAQVIAGNSKYKVIAGEVLFEGKEIKRLPPEKRVKMGIVSAWQAPPAIKGVKLDLLLEKISKRKIKIFEGKHLLEREINVDFSGGEKKISEILQIIALNPKLVIFDEIDSGLDIKKMEFAAKIIKKELVKNKTSILIITHSGHILNFLKPNITHILVDGKIICSKKDYKKVLRAIKKYGYEKCKKCPFLADRS